MQTIIGLSDRTFNTKNMQTLQQPSHRIPAAQQVNLCLRCTCTSNASISDHMFEWVMFHVHTTYYVKHFFKLPSPPIDQMMEAFGVESINMRLVDILCQWPKTKNNIPLQHQYSALIECELPTCHTGLVGRPHLWICMLNEKYERRRMFEQVQRAWIESVYFKTNT